MTDGKGVTTTLTERRRSEVNPRLLGFTGARDTAPIQEETELFRDFIARTLEREGYEVSREPHVPDQLWLTTVSGRRLLVTVEDVS